MTHAHHDTPVRGVGGRVKRPGSGSGTPRGTTHDHRRANILSAWRALQWVISGPQSHDEPMASLECGALQWWEAEFRLTVEHVAPVIR